MKADCLCTGTQITGTPAWVCSARRNRNDRTSFAPAVFHHHKRLYFWFLWTGPPNREFSHAPWKRSSRHNCHTKAFTATLHEENTFLLYLGILTTGIRPNEKSRLSLFNNREEMVAVGLFIRLCKEKYQLELVCAIRRWKGVFHPLMIVNGDIWK